jgi:hypothetical protein
LNRASPSPSTTNFSITWVRIQAVESKNPAADGL